MLSVSAVRDSATTSKSENLGTGPRRGTFDMPMEKEYFKNYRGFEGVVLKIDGSINYTPIKLSEVLSE